MYKNIFELVEEKAKLLERKGILRNRKIFVGPVNYVTMYLIKWLQENGYNVEGVIADEDAEHQSLMEVTISMPEEVLVPYRHNIVILLTDSSKTYFNRKMDVLEYYYNVQRYVMTEPIAPPKKSLLIKQKLKDKCWRYSLRGIHVIYGGKKVYRSLRKQIDSEQKIFLFPYRSIGDIYILGVYKNEGAQIFENSYLLVVVGEICKKVARKMGFRNVTSIEQSKMDAIIRFKDVFYNEVSDVSVLHYNYSFAGIAESIANYKNINFFKIYQYLVFGKKVNRFFRVLENTNEAEEYCKTNGIIKGNSVILAPYAKSILPISIVFWESLANSLIEKGYVVFTNCGSEEELTIKGTQRILFPIELANSVVEYAGIFVGLRSGLCDLISCSKCKKIIIYPKWKNINTSIEDFFTFDNLENVRMLKEYECELTSKREDVEKVVKLLQSFDQEQ